jgi:hypothetical protein
MLLCCLLFYAGVKLCLIITEGHILKVRFEFLTVVKIAMLFWVVAPCGLVSRYQDFGERYCLHLQP